MKVKNDTPRNNDVGISALDSRISALVPMLNAAIEAGDLPLFGKLDAEHAELCNRRNWEAVYNKGRYLSPHEYASEHLAKAKKYELERYNRRAAHTIRSLDVKVKAAKHALFLLEQKLAARHRDQKAIWYFLGVLNVQDCAPRETASLRPAGAGSEVLSVPLVRRSEPEALSDTSAGGESKAKLFGRTCRITWTS